MADKNEHTYSLKAQFITMCLYCFLSEKLNNATKLVHILYFSDKTIQIPKEKTFLAEFIKNVFLRYSELFFRPK